MLTFWGNEYESSAQRKKLDTEQFAERIDFVGKLCWRLERVVKTFLNWKHLSESLRC